MAYPSNEAIERNRGLIGCMHWGKETVFRNAQSGEYHHVYPSPDADMAVLSNALQRHGARELARKRAWVFGDHFDTGALR